MIIFLRTTLAVLLGFVLPGAFLSGVLGSNLPVVSTYILSTLNLFCVVFVLGVLGVPLTFGHLTLALAATTLGAWLWLHSRRRQPGNEPVTGTTGRSAGLPLVPLLAIGVMGMIFVLRVTLQPISGWDTEIRWDLLARLGFVCGRFDFYPPIRSEDFRLYFLCDGIAPLVSFSYLYLYLAVGQMVPSVTCIPVFMQGIAIGTLVYHLANRSGGRDAGWSALVILAASPLCFWSTGMGQETGLTAISLAATVWFLLRPETYKTVGGVILCAASAALGALAREYGVAFAAFAFVVLIVRRLPLRQLVAFALTSSLLILPWYMRNWIRTGHPFYSIPVPFLFEGNPVYTGLLGALQHETGFLSDPPGVAKMLLGYLAFLAPLAVVSGCAGIRRSFHGAPVPLLAVLLGTILWLYSVGFTAGGGGYLYVMRVLNPVIVLLAAIGGTWVACYLKSGAVPWKKRTVQGVLYGGILWSLPWCLTVPQGPFVVPAGEWFHTAFSPSLHPYAGPQQRGRNLELNGGGIVLTDNAYIHIGLLLQGKTAVPVWSPEVSYLFASSVPMAEALARLRAGNITEIVLTSESVNSRYLNGVSFFRDLPKTVPVRPCQDGFLVYRIPDV